MPLHFRAFVVLMVMLGSPSLFAAATDSIPSAKATRPLLPRPCGYDWKIPATRRTELGMIRSELLRNMRVSVRQQMRSAREDFQDWKLMRRGVNLGGRGLERVD